MGIRDKPIAPGSPWQTGFAGKVDRINPSRVRGPHRRAGRDALVHALLVHAQYQGYWSHLGMQFQEEMEALLERHVLKGLVDAPWVRTDDPESGDDDGFFAALQELVAYAFEESVRIKKKGGLFPSWHEIPVRSSHGILQEVQSLLQKYRSELVRRSRLLDQGGRA